MQRKITKAVFPVAGLGSRFLPATKASPKEMLPIVDKPLIQYAVEEAAAAGITDLIFVTGRNKRAIEDHFDLNPELERALARKAELLEHRAERAAAGLPLHVHPPGGTARPRARGAVCGQRSGDEPFAVLLADDLIDANPPTIGEMAERFEQEGCSLLGVEEVPREQTGSYGIVSPDDEGRGDADPRIVEKPGPQMRRPTLAVVGRIRPDAGDFRPARGASRAAGGEIQLTDAHRGCSPGARAGDAYRRQALRLRQQARLPEGDGRARPAAPGHRQGFRGIPAYARTLRWLT
jgi:UTP--glucose-1-phosphate uridylyltransferase